MGKRKENAIGLYLEAIRDGRPKEAIQKYAGAVYKQHSTGVADGPEGFVEFFESFLPRNRKRDIQIVRALEDGRYVFLQVFQSLNGGQSKWVTTDFFDTDESGRLTEHWDVIAAYTPATPSGHTSLDGRADIRDLHKTEENKRLILKFFAQVLFKEDGADSADKYISHEIFVRHGADQPDGLAAFAALLRSKNRPVYRRIVLLVGEGNFVATLSEASLKGTPVAQVDLFRIGGGKIAEHWENTEPVPPKNEWKNSGKF
jgi:predicted SnoaL-like aldol condensation-catalyzing enzyme